MNVVLHQAVSPDIYAEMRAPLRHQRHIAPIIIIPEKCSLAPVTSLRDVVGQPRHYDPGYPCHSAMLCHSPRSFQLDRYGAAGTPGLTRGQCHSDRFTWSILTMRLETLQG